MKIKLTLLFFISCLTCLGQHDDRAEVGRTVDKLFRFLSFADTASVQLDSVHTVFAPDGKLVGNFGKKPLTFTPHQFVEAIRNSIRSGQQSSAREVELARSIDVFGKIAHVFSTYELTITGKDGKTVRRGINSIQLLKLDGKWLIWSLTWDRESDTLKVPREYLRKR